MNKNAEKRIAEWVNLSKQKNKPEPMRGYFVRYEHPEIDSERARKEAAEAAELANRYLSDRQA